MISQPNRPSSTTSSGIWTRSGGRWRFGCEDAPNRIEGTASEFARVGVRRRQLADTGLRAHGQLAEVALANLKAYL
jgi:hypothetical protein